MADVCAQVGDGLLGVLAADEVGGVHIPQGGQLVAGEVVQHIAQARGAAENAGGFQQQHHPGLRGRRDRLRQKIAHFRCAGVRVGIAGLDADVRHAQPGRDVDAFADFGQRFGRVAHGGRTHGVHARDRQLLLVQPAERGGGGVFVKRAVFFGEQRAVDVVQLDSLEPQVAGNIAKIVERAVVPALGRKRKLH